LRKCYDAGEDIPSEEEVARRVGVTVNRLGNALKYTRPLLSLDAPLFTGNTVSKGSGAGGDAVGQQEIPISERIQWYVSYVFLVRTIRNDVLLIFVRTTAMNAVPKNK
jgi:hypothetical protein